MTKEEKIKMLVKVADFLDRMGETETADFVDGMISEESADMPREVNLEIPEDEYDLLRKVYEALGESLK